MLLPVCLLVGRGTRVVAVAVVLASVVVPTADAGDQTIEDVAVRDRLIADQEALLDAYRCRFSVDVEAVGGGCRDGVPAEPAAGPGAFDGMPSAGDIAVRDHLVADQEALLNAYRCQFNVDTNIVPGGCTEQLEPITVITVQEPESAPTQVPAALTVTGIDITDRVEAVIEAGGLGPEGEQADEEIVAAEVAMLVLVNALRLSQGLDQVSYVVDLALVARRWSQTMVSTRDFRHNPSFSGQIPPGWTVAAENIAMAHLGSSENRWERLTAAVVAAFDLLADSPGHYANMVNPDIDAVGIGIALNRNTVYLTQNFAAYPLGGGGARCWGVDVGVKHRVPNPELRRIWLRHLPATLLTA